MDYSMAKPLFMGEVASSNPDTLSRDATDARGARWPHNWLAMFALAMLGGLSPKPGLAQAVVAQAPAQSGNNDSLNAQPAVAGQPPEAPPPRQDVELRTKDQVVLHVSYFAGTAGKQTIPVILLHGWEGPLGAGRRSDLFELAAQLQKKGYAVAVPDLRGHGESTTRQLQGARSVTLNREQFRPAELREMTLDIEAVRSFLVDENNAGKLNLDALCVVGFEMGCVVALNWIQYDWSVPSFPSYKQGQDAKGFVLVSPQQSFRGANIRQALSSDPVRRQLSAMVIYGNDAPEADDAERLVRTLRRSHRAIDPNTPDANALQDLFVVELDTSLSGTKLLRVPAFSLADRIDEFLKRRFTARLEAFPWRDRSLP